MRVLELFSGTHSVGKVCKERGMEVVSIDRDLPSYDKSDKEKKYQSDHHIQKDILTWDYKKEFKRGDFDIITASPVCMFWSILRKCWVNSYYNPNTLKFSRKPKDGFVIFTREHLQNDIDNFGKPMVDKVLEIIDYFQPKWWWIENPKSSSMRHYLKEKGLEDSKVVSYCQYGFEYQKNTRIWTNIDFTPKVCKKDCGNMVGTLHKSNLGNTERRNRVKKHLGTIEYTSKLGRYRLPPQLVRELLNSCV